MDGYSLSYFKADATAAAFSGDEYAAPLVAYWRRDLGRTTAVLLALGGEYSGRMRGWMGYGDFLQTLNRWLMGSETPAGLALRPRVRGTEWRLDRARIAESQAVAQASGGGAVTDLSRVWLAPRQPEYSGIRNWLLAALMALLLTEALATRLGWRFTRQRRPG